MMPSRCTAILIFVLVSSGLAQTPARQASGAAEPIPPQATGEVAKALAGARESLAGGRAEEAITSVNSVLARYPANREAVEIKITALLERQQFEQALATYDAYTTALKKPDVGVLGLIARAELRRVVRRQPGDAVATAAALERLAGAGDGEALQALKRAAASQSSTSRDALAPLVSLARLGDTDAATRLAALLPSPSWEGKTAVIRALQDARARSQAPKIVALLDDPQPQVRAAAALALGVLQFADAVPKLQGLFKHDLPIVRLFASVALKRLGQTTADLYVAEMLRSEVPEVRLIAAEAYQSSKTTQWVPPVKELLSDRNELNRLRAADLIACSDPATARRALLTALDSPDPLLRNEAARILEARDLFDAKIVRRLLGDAYDGVRVYGAGAALRAVTPSRQK
jgi:hypothetical protein